MQDLAINSTFLGDRVMVTNVSKPYFKNGVEVQRGTVYATLNEDSEAAIGMTLEFRTVEIHG